MKRLLRLGLAIVAGMAVVLGSLAVWNYFHQPVWPGFPPSADNDKPQSQVTFDDGVDYGYRTGNLIPVTVVIKAPPSVQMETESLSLEGDMHIVDKTIAKQKAADGSTYIGISLKLQAFDYKQKLVANAAMSYRVNGSNTVMRLDVNPIEVYPTKTYDGRPTQHPHDPLAQTRQGMHSVYTLSMLIIGGGGMLLLWLRIKSKRPKSEDSSNNAATETAAKPAGTPMELAIAKYDAVLNGDASLATLKELARALRIAFAAETATSGMLLMRPDGQQAALGAALGIIEDAAVWAEDGLASDELERLKDLKKHVFCS